MKSQSCLPQSAAGTAVHSLWQTAGEPPFRTEHILPMGVVEIIFNFSHGSPIAASIGGAASSLPPVFINGFNTSPVTLQLPQQQAFFGIRLHPLSVREILNVPAAEFLDRAVDLTLLSKTFNSLWHQLAEQADFQERVRTIEQWVICKCIQPQPRDAFINEFLSDVHQHDVSVAQLSGRLCYSSRQLSRRVTAATGLNTEELLLYKKYLHAVHLMEQPGLSLTQIGYASAFSDQSHFIRTFKHFTQRTPGAYQRARGPRAGHLLEDVR